MSRRSKKLYYFDNNATTLIYDKHIRDAIIAWIDCGNPSNTLHEMGMIAREKIEECRSLIATDMKVKPEEIYFTSGATESNNIIIQGIIKKYLKKGGKYTVIASSFEHHSVLNIFKHYQHNPSLEVIFIEPNQDIDSPYYGCIDPSHVEKAIQNAKNQVILVSIMHANNETGSIQQIAEIGTITNKYKVFFHTDATQTMGKYIIHPHTINVNALSFSGHKFHGPKGIGCLFVSEGTEFENLSYGGEQEFEKRPGTENVSGIVGMTYALLLAHNNREKKNKEMLLKKIWILKNLKDKFKFQLVSPHIKNTLPNTIFIMLNDIQTCNKTITSQLNNLSICVGVGSACQTGKLSHVLESMKVPTKDKDKVIRISLSDYTKLSECDYLVSNLTKIVKKNS